MDIQFDLIGLLVALNFCDPNLKSILKMAKDQIKAAASKPRGAMRR